MKKTDGLHSTNFKWLRQIKGNSINGYDIFKVHNFRLGRVPLWLHGYRLFRLTQHLIVSFKRYMLQSKTIIVRPSSIALILKILQKNACYRFQSKHVAFEGNNKMLC
jgi:hypothetical protein